MQVVQNLFVIIAFVIFTLSMQIISLKTCPNYKPFIQLPKHMTTIPVEYSQRFSNVARLYTSDNTLAEDLLKSLFSTRVCIIGLGGVGSWVAEALARSGVGKLTLIDADEVCISNTNRQITAHNSNYGKYKADSLKERILDINPIAEVVTCYEFARPTNVDELLHNATAKENRKFDYVIDAVDDVIDKAAIIDSCVRSGTPVLTSGGAGGLRDPSRITVSDLVHAQGDNLLMRVRRRLRKKYGYPLSLRKKGEVGRDSPTKRVRRWRILAAHSAPTGSRRYLAEKKAGPDNLFISSSLSESDADVADDSASITGSDDSSVNAKSGMRKCDYSFGNACFSAGTMGFMLASCVVNAICASKDRGALRDRMAVRPKQLGHYFRRSLYSSSTDTKMCTSAGEATAEMPTLEADCCCGKEQTMTSNVCSSSSEEDIALRARQIESVEARLTAPEQQEQQLSQLTLFDAHCHLQLEPLFLHANSAIALAIKHHISGVSVCGTAPGEDWQRVRQLFERNRSYVVPSFGLHPWRIAEYKESVSSRQLAKECSTGWVQELETLLMEIPQAHVGECGLDKAVLKSGVPYVVQEDILLQHLLLAGKYQRTLTLHCVSGCWDSLLALLKNHQKLLRSKQAKRSNLEREIVNADTGNMPPAIVLHSCNSMPKEMVAHFLRLGSTVYFSLSAGGRAGLTGKALDMVRLVPSDRLLIETDSPDQLPSALREAPTDRDTGQTASVGECCGLLYNEPALLVFYCHQLAVALDVSVIDLAEQTTRNVKHAYQLS